MDMPLPEPQAEHLWLQKLVGDWTVEGEASMGPDQPPHKMSGTESVRTLGGLWTLGELRSTMPDGAEAVTLMTLGYDPAKGRFVGTFIGSMMTHMWIYDGKLDTGKNELALIAEGPSMSGDGTMIDYRDVITFRNDDHRVLTSFTQGKTGAWDQQFMEAHYRRIALAARDDRLIGRLQLGKHRAAAPRRSEVHVPELRHESLPHFRTALLQELRPDRKFIRHLRVPPPPGAHLRQQRHELDRRLGQAVDALLPVRGVVASRQQSRFDEALQPVGEDVGRDPLLRMREQLAKMPARAEHDVADHDQAPAVAERLQRQIDRTARPLRARHRFPQPTACKMGLDWCRWQLIAMRNRNEGSR